MPATDTGAPSTSPVLGYAFVIGLTVLSWYGLWRYAWPALRSQEGRADRMSRDRRLRRLAFGLLVMIYPLMFTAGCVFMAFTSSSTAGSWTANLIVWAVFAALLSAPILGLVALIFRTIDRHRARVLRRELGLPDPPAPWWPSAVVVTWALICVGVSIAGWIVAWRFFNAYAERRSALIQSLMQQAEDDPGVQQLQADRASRATIEERLAALTGTSADLADLKRNIQVFLIGNLVAFVVVVAITALGAVLLYRRQKRRVADYQTRITESTARAAQLAI